MKSICLFCSYFTSDNIPNYVQFYIKELTKHFTKVIFITNEKKLVESSLSFLENNKIEPFFVANEGHDFGMWYKAMLKYNIEEYDRLGLVNDSCILFKPLDDYFNWLNSQNLDYAGMTDTEEIIYHIQSYFLTINKKAIKPTLEFFKQHGLQVNRQDVINIYELGLSKYLGEINLSTGAWFSYKKYMPKYNPSLYAAKKMITDGFPLIKKKILFNSFSINEYKEIGKHNFDNNPKNYISTIKDANKTITIFDLNLLKADGYNPTLKKIMLLIERIEDTFLSWLKFIYRKFKIRELRNKFNHDSIK